MTNDPTRNHRIAHEYAAGASIAALAEQYTLAPTTARDIVRKMKPLLEWQRERPIADGMSLAVALKIERAIGIWPSPESAGEIAERRRDILRSPGNMRMALEELDVWLTSLEVRNDDVKLS